MSEARAQRRRKRAYGKQAGGIVRTDVFETGSSLASHPQGRAVADGIAAWLRGRRMRGIASVSENRFAALLSPAVAPASVP